MGAIPTGRLASASVTRSLSRSLRVSSFRGLPRSATAPTRNCLGVTTRSVKNRTLSRQSNEISWLKNKTFAYRGGLLGTRHRNFPFQPLPDTAARGGTDEPNLLACSFEQIVY